MTRRFLGALGMALALSTTPALAGPKADAPQTGLREETLDIATSRDVAHFKVAIADTEPTRERGLMFVKHLAPNRGMLFDFKTVQPVAFWMKNTFIPLDMVFIAPDGRIVSIAHDARPFDETPIPSGGPVLAVLEIAGGRAAQLGLAPGDRVTASQFHP